MSEEKPNANLEIHNERRFPQDRDTLFAAVADPAKLARWWGPHGFENRITAFDFRPGGSWRIVMTASNGDEFDNHWSFLAIENGRMVRARHHLPVHDFVLEMRFEDHAGGSRLVWRMDFEPTEENQAMAHFLKAANDQNLDRLAQFLEGENQ
ncbi:SRPBCC domain-containing protein [Martelella mediterranea]|uniref:Activator of Hsp90 ATPase 1 family protein n=1 Tax=Martelella mediterranea DSM 17316 TaxID=1122214 RepID=A0A1U9Z236_9HYPH|nr:SRPBCC domain-containing protein [Martelella mediterranea]AQZ51720.1 Activator of Hsp90 ATPase 1 family protein [Martelella mediterranea DSM 17316]